MSVSCSSLTRRNLRVRRLRAAIIFRRVSAPPVLDLPTFADVERAAQQIAGHAHRTPVVTSRTIDARTGATVFFKCENLQRVGAFKFRGAFNALSSLSADQRARGVVTFSSGNHAQAVALAGRLLGIHCVIVMPTDAPGVKREATLGYGAEVVLYDREYEEREVIGRDLAEKRGLAIIPPYDHPDIIAGAGTSARELHLDVGQLDFLLVPCGGGGLLSGSALASAALAPDCRVIGVEPSTADDGARSFRTKARQTVRNPVTVADGARTPSLGTLTFPLVLRHVHDMMTVMVSWNLAMVTIALAIEPTGALGAAALLDGKLDARGTRVGVILSGGNVDFSQIERWKDMA